MMDKEQPPNQADTPPERPLSDETLPASEAETGPAKPRVFTEEEKHNREQIIEKEHRKFVLKRSLGLSGLTMVEQRNKKARRVGPKP